MAATDAKRSSPDEGYGAKGTPRAVLRAARAFRGWTQQELAERAELSRWTVCRIERGHEEPSLRTAQRLCQALGLSSEVLFPQEKAPADTGAPSPFHYQEGDSDESTGSSRSTLEEQLDTRFAPAWRPEPGEKLVGTVTELGERDGAYGSYPIVTVRQSNGEELAIHAFHDVLQNELARIAPKHGDEIGILYSGKDADRGYHRYRVRRGGDDAALSWAKYAGADGGEQGPADSGERDDGDIPF